MLLRRTLVAKSSLCFLSLLNQLPVCDIFQRHSEHTPAARGSHSVAHCQGDGRKGSPDKGAEEGAR